MKHHAALPDIKSDPVAYLHALFGLAVGHAAPENCLPQHLPSPPKGRTLVVSVGKAAASMAKAVDDAWPADASLSGFALTRYGHGCESSRITVVEASHPVPDSRGFEYTKKIVEDVSTMGENDLLLFLVSGGGSALLTMPADTISLEEKQQINKGLLMSGAPIGEMNIVRKHLSAVKGGRLAQLAMPAKIVTLAISDVPRDDPSTIASGPTVADVSTSADALTLLDHYGIAILETTRRHLSDPVSETPKPGDPTFIGTQFAIISRPADMLEAVIGDIKKSGTPVISLSADIEGEASAVASEHAQLAFTKHAAGETGLIVSGGETTVTVSNATTPGRGGRNCEYLLALAIQLNGNSAIYAVAADTDGIDGSEDNAGAIITPDTLERGNKLGLDASNYLARHDSYTYFEKLGDLIISGPTRTNVNDFRAILIG